MVSMPALFLKPNSSSISEADLGSWQNSQICSFLRLFLSVFLTGFSYRFFLWGAPTGIVSTKYRQPLTILSTPLPAFSARPSRMNILCSIGLRQKRFVHIPVSIVLHVMYSKSVKLLIVSKNSTRNGPVHEKFVVILSLTVELR